MSRKKQGFYGAGTSSSREVRGRHARGAGVRSESRGSILIHFTMIHTEYMSSRELALPEEDLLRFADERRESHGNSRVWTVNRRYKHRRLYG